MLWVEVGMRGRCANKASAECFRWGRNIGEIPSKEELCYSSSGSPEGLHSSPVLCERKRIFGEALSEHGGAFHLDRHHHLHPPWPLGHVRLISFLGLV